MDIKQTNVNLIKLLLYFQVRRALENQFSSHVIMKTVDFLESFAQYNVTEKSLF